MEFLMSSTVEPLLTHTLGGHLRLWVIGRVAFGAEFLQKCIGYTGVMHRLLVNGSTNSQVIAIPRLLVPQLPSLAKAVTA